MRHIYIDADSSNNIKFIESVAKEHNIPVTLYCNGDHLITSKYSEVNYVEKGSDVADFTILSRCHTGDIVVTRDYGLAAMVLTKKAICIHPSGYEYTEENIDQLLFRRYCRKQYGNKARKAGLSVPDFECVGIEKLLKDLLKNSVLA